MMDRQQMIDEMEWLAAGSGTGFGICSVGNSMEKPSDTQPDLKSVVAIKGDPSIYTDDEIAKLHAFSKTQTEKYDKMFHWRLGCNMIIIGKMVGWHDDRTPWLRKRLSWDMGQMYSDTLDEALAIFDD